MERKEAIRKHTTDMLAVEKHVLTAVRGQLKDDDLSKHTPARTLIERIERTLDEHVDRLEELASQHDTNLKASLKEALTTVAGLAASTYDRLREHRVTRMLRDDYTALNHVAAAYTTYHAFGLAVGDGRIAELALRHLNDLTPYVMELNEVMPRLVVEEVARENDTPVDRSVAERAVANVQAAWQPSVESGV